MTEVLCEFFSWAVRDVIFFSGDVQTTTIAVAITSSLCCSIVVAIVHVVAAIRPSRPRDKTAWRYHRANSSSSLTSRRHEASMWISTGRVHVPCVKCGKFFADDGCRFVTCQSCCFSVLSCQIHQKKSLTSTPCDIKQKELDLSSAGMVSCPERLGFVGAQLTCLNLADNQLRELPAEIGCLRGLQRLCLQHNQLSMLPATLASLVKLDNLDISYNQLQVIPGCVVCLNQLQELRVSHNELSKLTPDIRRLKQLNLLDISHNKIEELCDELFSIIHLEYLLARSNPLCRVPAAIGNLVKLVALDLRECGLTGLPHTIGKCSNLHCLKLQHNKLKTLPSQVGQLSHLQVLQLGHNQLQVLPAMLAFLKDTVTICVKGNPLLPKEEYPRYTWTPESGSCLIPSLRELTGRVIVKCNIPNSQTLPTVLQDMLKSVSFCSHCGGPVFDAYSSKIIPWHFTLGSETWIPLHQQMCSPHPQHHSR